jgi:STE24 endopeptidase
MKTAAVGAIVSDPVGAIARDLVLTALAAEAAVRLLRPRPAARPAPRADVRTYFSPEELSRGRRFARPQLALGAAAGAIELAVVALAAARPPRLMRRGGRRPVAASAATAASLGLAARVPSLPLSAIARRRALAAGLATQSWRGWAADLVKASAIEAGFAGAAGATVSAIARRSPRHWWLVAAAGSVGVGALLAMLGPVLLDPIFNNFEPLSDEETRADVLQLAAAAGIHVEDVFVVDASRRTTAANAYVTGLGPTKRVVLFDTLLERYNRDEVRVVVAHELSHVRHRDVRRGITFAALVAVPAARAAARVSGLLAHDPASPAALPALSLAAVFVSAPVGAIAARLSRAIERRADQDSLELTRAPEAFISFERRIAVQNLVDIEPPPLLHALLATHPATAERIGAAAAFADEAPASAAGATGSPTPPRPPAGPRTRAGS